MQARSAIVDATNYWSFYYSAGFETNLIYQSLPMPANNHL